MELPPWSRGGSLNSYTIAAANENILYNQKRLSLKQESNIIRSELFTAWAVTLAIYGSTYQSTVGPKPDSILFAPRLNTGTQRSGKGACPVLLQPLAALVHMCAAARSWKCSQCALLSCPCCTQSKIRKAKNQQMAKKSHCS